MVWRVLLRDCGSLIMKLSTNIGDCSQSLNKWPLRACLRISCLKEKSKLGVMNAIVLYSLKWRDFFACGTASTSEINNNVEEE